MLSACVVCVSWRELQPGVVHSGKGLGSGAACAGDCGSLGTAWVDGRDVQEIACIRCSSEKLLRRVGLENAAREN